MSFQFLFGFLFQHACHPMNLNIHTSFGRTSSNWSCSSIISDPVITATGQNTRPLGTQCPDLRTMAQMLPAILKSRSEPQKKTSHTTQKSLRQVTTSKKYERHQAVCKHWKLPIQCKNPKHLPTGIMWSPHSCTPPQQDGTPTYLQGFPIKKSQETQETLTGYKHKLLPAENRSILSATKDTGEVCFYLLRR